MAIVGPHIALPEFLGRGKVNGVSSAQKKVSRGGKNQSACSAEQGFADWNQVP